MTIVFFNGAFVEEREARLPVTDRAFLFGDGVFTTLKVKQGAIENYRTHLERLQQHCAVLSIEPPKIEDAYIQELIEKNGAASGLWCLKIAITGGMGDELYLPDRSDCNLLITLKPYQEHTKPFRLTVHESPSYRPMTRVKSMAFLDRLWLKEVARQDGFDDAIVTTQEGFLLETAFCNLLWLHGKDLYYPDMTQPLMNGVTIGTVLDAAVDAGFTLHEVKAFAQDIPDEAQVFVCNSLLGLMSASCIDKRFFLKDYSMEKKLKEAFSERIISSSSKFS